MPYLFALRIQNDYFYIKDIIMSERELDEANRAYLKRQKHSKNLKIILSLIIIALMCAVGYFIENRWIKLLVLPLAVILLVAIDNLIERRNKLR